MAQDIVPMEPEETVCPRCMTPLLLDWQLAVYESGDSFQFGGLRIKNKCENNVLKLFSLNLSRLGFHHFSKQHKVAMHAFMKTLLGEKIGKL